MDFIHVNGHIIHYRHLDNHSDRTFLFLNSLGTDFRIWDEIVNRFADHGNILLYDKRGHGLSEFSIAKTGLDDYAEDAKALLSALKIEKCIPVGISLGGMIAQILAYNHPELTEKIILCDTSYKIGNTEMWNERIEQIRTHGIQVVSDGLMKRWFAPFFHAKYPEKVSGYKNMLDRCNPEGYIQACESIRDANTQELAKSLKMPALCIVGSEDLSTTPDSVRALSQLIPGSKLEIIKGSGHIPSVDNPEIFSNLIIDFIK